MPSVKQTKAMNIANSRPVGRLLFDLAARWRRRYADAEKRGEDSRGENGLGAATSLALLDDLAGQLVIARVGPEDINAGENESRNDHAQADRNADRGDASSDRRAEKALSKATSRMKPK